MKEFEITYFGYNCVTTGAAGMVYLKCKDETIMMRYKYTGENNEEENRYYVILSKFENLHESSEYWIMQVFEKIIVILIEQVVRFFIKFHAIIENNRFTAVKTSAEHFDSFN